jgi:hypothetical protein
MIDRRFGRIVNITSAAVKMPIDVMPGLLPNVDPDGLLEYSVVYTDRSLNHMSQAFQGVMRDISADAEAGLWRTAAPSCPAAAPSAWRRWRASSPPAASAW